MTLDLDVAPTGVFERDDELREAGHEQTVFCRDGASGLRAIVSVHDTTLGPALGGSRFYPYRSEAHALRDALRLSQGMTHKAAAAGLPLGGGKAVIIGDPATDKTPGLLRAYGRFIERLAGTYVTAADVGTTAEDLDVIGEETTHVVGRTVAAGGSGDSGLSTARGVFCAMRAAASIRWPEQGLHGRTVGVEGLGKVGYHLIGLLLGEGASVVVCEPASAARDRVFQMYGPLPVLGSVLGAPIDVYAPCALGGTLAHDSLGLLRAELVCGAANNQLALQEVDQALFARGITWVPDFVANAGGLIQVGGELLGSTSEDVAVSIEGIAATTHEILSHSHDHGIPTGAAALAIVRARLAAAGHGHRSR